MFSDEEIEKHNKIIDAMSHLEMAKLRRFAKPGHIYFRFDSPFLLRFENRFQQLGGMTPKLSKRINLEKGM